MEGRVFSDQEQLLQFLRRLKEVFDVCDEDADGYIRVEHLEDLGLRFGQGDEVRVRWGSRATGQRIHSIVNRSLCVPAPIDQRTSGTWWA